jgi:hypothetical protein
VICRLEVPSAGGQGAGGEVKLARMQGWSVVRRAGIIHPGRASSRATDLYLESDVFAESFRTSYRRVVWSDDRSAIAR